MSLYETYAEDIAQAIETGILRAGERLPSVREACRQRGISPATVFKAYYLLETRGLIHTAPRSGFFVNPRSGLGRLPEPEPSRPGSGRHALDTMDLVYAILHSLKLRSAVPLGCSFPDPSLFPLEDLRHALARAMRKFGAWNTFDDLPPGHEPLQRQILKRYLAHGVPIASDELVLTNGAMSALNLCVRAVARPGRAVVVESPCSYMALQALERNGLRAIEVATDPREGVDLGHLAAILEGEDKPAACWFMTNYQHPLGALMPDDKKRELVRLLARHEVPLIEDDVYAELYHGDKPPVSAKSFDRRGLVLHCSSFSKCLAPGYRVGWVAAGRLARDVERLKLITLISGSVPVQAAISAYLHEGAYEAHLRRLRRSLAGQMAALRTAVERHFPAGTRVSRPQGGYFLWLELPDGVDALRLFEESVADHVSVGPGPIFSARKEFRNCIRLNSGLPWTPKVEEAVAKLGRRVARHAGLPPAGSAQVRPPS